MKQLQPISKEELIKRALKANEDIRNGNVYTEKEAEKLIKEW